MSDFEPFPKIARLNREVVITEKIDGTNAQIVVGENGVDLWVGSRKRWITPGKSTDNYGFAAWVQEHADELRLLGPGRHFGEWWGQGIARGYGLTDKRFSLFNVGRWLDREDHRGYLHGDGEVPPACCSVVPVLARGYLAAVKPSLDMLRRCGSFAAPGFGRPEGVIVFHAAANTLFKVTLENDEVPKGSKEIR